MARNRDVFQFISERVTVGLSGFIGLTALPGQIAMTVKYMSGGTLEIGGSYSLVNGVSTAFSWGNGYQLSSSEIFNANMSGGYLLAASGATSIAHVIRGLSEGF